MTTATVIDIGPRLARAALSAERLARITTAPQLEESAYQLGRHVAAGQLDLPTVAHRLVVVGARIGLCQTEATYTIAAGLRAGITGATPKATDGAA